MRTRIAPLLLALGAAGCATSPTSSLDAFAQRSANHSFELLGGGVDPPSTLVLPVAHDQQTQGPSCGAHALASVINYWRGENTVSGDAIFAATPPAHPGGYSLTELMSLARSHGLLASAVRLGEDDLHRELEAGRPVLVPVRVPAVYLQPWTLPGANEPLLGLPARVVASRTAWVSERTGMAMVNHYLLVVGYEDEKFVVLEPILGFRTLTAERLARYRADFNNAALVFSPAPAQDQSVALPRGRAGGSP